MLPLAGCGVRRWVFEIVFGILFVYAVIGIQETFNWLRDWEKREVGKTFDIVYTCVSKGDYAKAQQYTEGMSKEQLRDFWQKSISMLKSKNITEHSVPVIIKSKGSQEVLGVFVLRAKNCYVINGSIHYRLINGKAKITYLEPIVVLDKPDK